MTWKERISAIPRLVGPVLVIISILGTLFFGIATATEAAAMGAVASFLLLVIRKKASWMIVNKALRETVVITGFIMFLAVAAKFFSATLYYFQIPQHVVDILTSLPLSPQGIIFIFMVMYIILGTFLDPLGMMVTTMLVVLPVLHNLGFSPIWFCVLLMINMELAQITPPVGILLYVIKGISPPSVSLKDILYGNAVFFIADLAILALVQFVPQVALWLPSKMF